MQNIPHKPDYLTDAEWQFILERDRHQCACACACRDNGRPDFCDQNLDVDHNHPRYLGGDDSVANLRLLCAHVNRGRAIEPDPKWIESNHWDLNLDVRALREIQRIAGHDAIDELADRIAAFERTLRIDGSPNNFRKLLLGGRITLLPGATGIGKTLLVQSVLHTFNRVIGVGRPRTRSVLWFAADTTMRDMTAKELEEEAYALKLINKPLKVNVANSFSDLDRGPMGADVTVMCPQSLWKKEASNRSDNEKRMGLVRFDTIIWDEGDWATDQVRHIADLGRHAVQWALTASPPLSNGQAKDLQTFIRRFVLIGREAIADYRRASELDGCLKLIAPVVCAAEHQGHEYILSGKDGEASTQMPPDHPLYLSAILQAVREADGDETNMRAIAGEDYFSPHIQVALPSIADIKTMKPHLQQRLDALYAHGHLHNHGWSVSAIFGGHDRWDQTLPEERDLSAKTRTGAWRHPFLIAKNNHGRAIEDSKRILLMCEIGERALNNWPISKFVDCTTSTSFVTLIQRDFGRPMRWPADRSHWLDDDKLKLFAASTIFVPSSLFTAEKRAAVDSAKVFIEDMLPRISGAGFLTWSDLMDGLAPEDIVNPINPTEAPLTPPQKYQVQNIVGGAVERLGAEIDRSQIEPLIACNFPAFGPRQVQKAVDYGVKLVTSKDFRDGETTTSQMIESLRLAPVSVMHKLKPQETYEISALVRFVKSDPVYARIWQDYVHRLQEGDVVSVHAVSERLRSIQQEMYRAPSRTRRLITGSKEKDDSGVLNEIARELASNLYQAGQAPTDKSLVPRAINRAAATLFGLPDAKEGGDMDHPAYHIAILGRYRRDLQAMARGLLISEGALGHALTLLAGLP